MRVIWKEILFVLFFGSLLYIMPKNGPSQHPESQACQNAFMDEQGAPD